MIQYIENLHLYMMIAIRVENSSHLDGTESEDDWRFGQTVTVVLLLMTVQELFKGIQAYR